MQAVIAFLAGVLFAVGLALGGMTLPSKVVGFLDFFGGNWDPSLAFVMAGAVVVYGVGFRVLRRRERPLVANQFQIPTKTEIDGRLIGGAALFGVGWGLGGFCPGPAVVATVSLGTSAFVFMGAMLAGMVAYRLVEPLWSRRQRGDSGGIPAPLT
ncbi:MAG: YeeE/YedE family protein [Myxococcota bacterium]